MFILKYIEFLAYLVLHRIFQKEVLNIMGQQNSTLPPAHDSPHLQLVDPHSNTYLNLRNGRIYLKNEVFVGTIQDVSYELDIYNFRRINDNYVVSVDYCSMDSEKDLCSSFSTLHYYIEKHEYTLFQKKEIRVQEGLKLLTHVLQSFEILYQKFGYFTPSAQMIFFNGFHDPKVWIHEDPKVTKNDQTSHNHKNLSLENKFVRQIVRLFDTLRDPENPMFRYSEFLPNQILTLRMVIELFIRREGDFSQNRQRFVVPFTEIHNIRRHTSPVVQRSVKPVISMNTSPAHSPVQSPRLTAPIQISNTAQRVTSRIPKMNIAYCSPTKPNTSTESAQFKESVKTSLKKTSSNSNFGHKINPSVQFTSTMPNSLRNSRAQERNVCIEVLSPIVSSSNCSVTPLYPKSSALKKQASQRYSEAEPTSFGRYLGRSSELQQISARKLAKDESEIIIENVPIEQMESIKTQRANFTSNEQLSFRKDFQTHKRHRTDYKIVQKSISSANSLNQKSAVNGGFMQKFNCNTIKSIHLLDEDREGDDDIIVDLKQIINKYRMSGSKA